MTSTHTIFGANGFVGAELMRQLAESGHTARAITRENWPTPGSDLGHVIFTIGMTADFRQRLTETMEAQVVTLHRALTSYRFDSFLYLSSTRVYANAASTSEDSALVARPADPDHVYNISKMAGEALCLAQASQNVRVARLSNLFGVNDTSPTFLNAVVREAAGSGKVRIGQAAQSAKDYLAVEDAASALLAISARGRQRLYNVGSGNNTSHLDIANLLRQYGADVSFAPDGPEVVFPPLDVARMRAECPAPQRSLADFVASVFSQPTSQGSRP
ncbi:MAG: NAD-dependent epimerase/dehydratase family protein [Bosea sp. (in: a-proteobacteria)]